MALDSLKWETPDEFKHEPRHDLESLFYVILTLCTYVERPGQLRSHQPLPQEKSICLNRWWAIGDYHELARSKAITLSSFKTYVLRSISPYWTDFFPFLEKLHKAIWPEPGVVIEQKNMATHKEFLRILSEAKEYYRNRKETPLEYAAIVDRPATSKRKIGVTASNDAKRRKKSTNPTHRPSPRKGASNSKRASRSRLAGATV